MTSLFLKHPGGPIYRTTPFKILGRENGIEDDKEEEKARIGK
jgi:hypothetical protein